VLRKGGISAASDYQTLSSMPTDYHRCMSELYQVFDHFRIRNGEQAGSRNIEIVVPSTLCGGNMAPIPFDLDLGCDDGASHQLCHVTQISPVLGHAKP
jgi:hypothetical protein